MQKLWLFLGISWLLQPLNAQQRTVAEWRTEGVEAALRFKTVARAAISEQVFLPLTDSSRTRWSNLPLEQTTRKGAQLKDLSDAEKQAVHGLLRTVLSQQGYQKVLLIMHYDDATHDRLEHKNSPIAHRYGQGNYWFSIFGTPSHTGFWGWKFEGHHISLNIAYNKGKITATPVFLGVNPALQTTGLRAGQAVMFEENEWGCRLFESLSAENKAKARLSDHPTDADVTAQAQVTAREGLPWNALTTEQQAWATRGAWVWFDNLHPALAASYKQDFQKNKHRLRFVWKGSNLTSDLHYFALKNGQTLIELTNRDGEIGHYHAFWRQSNTDFGQ